MLLNAIAELSEVEMASDDGNTSPENFSDHCKLEGYMTGITASWYD